MMTNFHLNNKFDPTEPLSGTAWCGKLIYFDTSMLTFSIGESKHLTRQQLYKVMYEMVIEYEDGEVIEIFDIVVEPHSAIIKWMIEDMNIEQAYPVESDNQRKMIMSVWEVLHLQDEFEYTFLKDYTEIVKHTKSCKENQ